MTALVVCALIGVALWRLGIGEALPGRLAPRPTQAPSAVPPPLPEAAPDAEARAVKRLLKLETVISNPVRFDAVEHTVADGDSVFGIAHAFKIRPETLLWANYDVLEDNPDSLRPGQVLIVPPTDGVYYRWKDGDSIDSVAHEFKAKPEDILDWGGNAIDLTNPVFEAGRWVMVPGGQREFKQWIVPTVARGRSGTAGIEGVSCKGGAVGSAAFIWPADNHYLSGNDYYSGHLGIDIAAGDGAPVYAAQTGVVTMAAGGWNYGYGNVLMVDHGNGYLTLYAHLSEMNVVRCETVRTGQIIALAGGTGNASGSHLHFEVRLNGGFVNPWFVLPPP